MLTLTNLNHRYPHILALALLAALLLSGCQSRGDSGDTYNPATDWPHFTMLSNGAYVGESEKGYYISTGFYLQFVDRETLTSTILCSKPNCLHNEEPDMEKREQCNAYFDPEGWSVPVFYVGGQLYVVTKVPTGYREWAYKVIRLSDDGSRRTELFSIPIQFINTAFFCIHRGVFYYTLESYGEDGEAGTSVYARPLNQKNGESKRLFTVQDTHNLSHGLLTGIGAYGNYLYVREYIGSYNSVLHIYDLRTDEHTVMPTPEGLTGVRNVTVVDDQLSIQYFDLETPQGDYDCTTCGVYYRANLDGTEAVFKYDTLTTGNHWTDDKYIYHLTQRRDEDGGSTPDCLHIFDYDMQEVCTLDIADFDTAGNPPDAILLMPLHDGNVIIEELYDKQWIHYIFSHEDIESGTIQPREFLRYATSDFRR